MLKKIIYGVLTFLIMLLIFYFSSENGQVSASTSSGVTDFLIGIYEKIFSLNLDHECLISVLNGPIRKIAHFSIYFLLGISSFNFIRCFNFKNSVLIASLFCMIYAISDEIHQLFINARSGQMMDILIDFIGSFIGIIFVYFVYKKSSCKKANNML